MNDLQTKMFLQQLLQHPAISIKTDPVVNWQRNVCQTIVSYLYTVFKEAPTHAHTHRVIISPHMELPA